MYRHRVVSILCAGLLWACATPPAEPPPEALLRDGDFGMPAESIDAASALAASADMRDFLQGRLVPLVRTLGPRKALATALRDARWLRLTYDSSQTRTAAQAFEARSGNCLSLVLMTAALAQELGLKVSYQEVITDESWSRQSGLYVGSGHVNVTLGARLRGEPDGFDPERELTIDFLPPADLGRQRTRALDERTVLAMFMNNRAVEALVRQDLDSAYAWARAAVRQDPRFLSGLNSLAVIYLRHGNAAAAEQVLHHVLKRQEGHAAAMANLIAALRAQDRSDEAAQWSVRLAAVQPVAPFHFYQLGMAALKAGDAAAARTWLRKEIARDPDYHEFHFALAQAEWALGHADEALRELALARDSSTQPASRDLYAAKLARLRLPAAEQVR
jgi:Tfp pilus assembly protein PilF